MTDKPNTISRLFIPTDDGKLEKVFVDQEAVPRRSYRTGEFYRPITTSDKLPCPGEEDVMIVDPRSFEQKWYRRVTPIDRCHFPKPFPNEFPPGHHIYPTDPE